MSEAYSIMASGKSERKTLSRLMAMEGTDSEDWQIVGIMRALLAVPGHYAFAVLMGYYYSVYHFVDHSPKVAASVLLAPVLAHGAYDALAMSGIVSPVIGGLSFFVLIYFCVKMHKVAKNKLYTLVEKDTINKQINV